MGPSPENSYVVTYEDKTMVCLPYELEKLAKAEAVDGWRLVDTTVSQAVPGMIEAHLRRPRHVSARPDPTAEGPPKRSEAASPRRRPEHKSPPTAPASEESDAPLSVTQLSRLVFILTLLIGIAWAFDNFGIIGLLLAVWLLPSLLKAALGMSRKTKRRSRRRKR